MNRGTVVRLCLAAASVIAIPVAAIASEMITYTYDAKGRLVVATRSGSINHGIVTTIAHDAAENRTNYAVAGTVEEGVPVVVVSGTTGADTFTGGDAKDVVYGLAGSDVLWGRGGNDELRGQDGVDTLHGELGDDALF